MSSVALQRGQLLRRLTPFVAADLLAFALVGLTERVSVVAYGSGVMLSATVVALTVWLPWGSLPSAARVMPALVFLLSASMLREAGGGAASGVGALALLPVFWIALHGTRAQLTTVLTGVAAFCLAPILLIGGSAYATSGYRTAVLFVAVSGIIGFTVQQLVEQVRAHADEVERHRHDLQRVAAVSRQVATSADARTDVCRAACEISAAKFAILLEPDGPDRLISTAMVGLDARPFASAPTRERSAPLIAFASRQPLLITDAANSRVLNLRLWAEHGKPASMLFEPVLHGDLATGVLIVGWDEPVSDSRAPAIVSLLASEAAIAIERADLVERLSELASTDPLTGTPNRRAWDTHLKRVLDENRSAASPLCVAMLDLDHFKAYNDAHGRQSGDRLLHEAAAAWRAVLRPRDLLARYGGEEFAALLPGCNEDHAALVLERLRDATPGRETCSVGVAEWDGEESPADLVGRADAALYAAKAAGRDRTVRATLAR
jgi:diguanylate cyclase (GGDEF)-like protein